MEELPDSSFSKLQQKKKTRVAPQQTVSCPLRNHSTSLTQIKVYIRTNHIIAPNTHHSGLSARLPL